MALKGTLSGNYSSSITLTSATYDNPVTVTGTISLAAAGIDLQAASVWSIVNAGLIESPGAAGAYGISLGAGGYVENLGGGVIASNVDIEFTGAAGTLVNAGSLGGGTGVNLLAGGSVGNSGLISSTFHGIKAPHGSVTVTNSGTITDSNASYSAIALNAGGSVTNAAGGTIMSNGYHGIYISGGGTVTNAGTIETTGVNSAVELIGGFNNRVIVDPGAVFQGLVQGGNFVGNTSVSVLELAPGGPGTLTGIGSTTGFYNFGSIAFDPGAVWNVSGPRNGFAGGQTISGFAQGDTIGLSNFNGTYVGFGSGTLTLSSNTHLSFEGGFPGEHFVVTPGTNTEITLACFAAGTRILTENGEVAVENLRPGAHVVSLSHQRALPVKWVGWQRSRAWPVCVSAGALGEGLPHRDLWLSPDHALFVGGALIPVRYLINGASIAEVACDGATYFHVELAAHAVLLAEGLPAESYLDTGNRAAFANGGLAARRHGPAAQVLGSRQPVELLAPSVPVSCAGA